MAFKMKGHTLSGPYQKKGNKGLGGDVNVLLRDLENYENKKPRGASSEIKKRREVERYHATKAAAAKASAAKNA